MFTPYEYHQISPFRLSARCRDTTGNAEPAQCRGTPTSLKARLTHEAGGDILEDALRRYLALHCPERVGVEDVKSAGNESAGQDVYDGMGPRVRQRTGWRYYVS